MEEIHLACSVADYVMVIPEQIFMFLSDEDSESAQGFTVKTERLNQIVLYPQKFSLRNFLGWYAVDYAGNISLYRDSLKFFYYC